MGQSRWMLVAVEGRYSGKRIPVTERGVSFGREEDNELVLDDENVSRHHAIVRLQRERPVLEDLKSRNGTFVNNKKVTRLELHEGDRIALGSHLFKVVPAATDEQSASQPQPDDSERTIIAPQALGERRAAPPTLAAIAVSGPGRGRVALEQLVQSPSAARPELDERTVKPDVASLSSAAEQAPSGPIFGGAAAPFGASVSAGEAVGVGFGASPTLQAVEVPSHAVSSHVDGYGGTPGGYAAPGPYAAPPPAATPASGGGIGSGARRGLLIGGVAAAVVAAGGIGFALSHGADVASSIEPTPVAVASAPSPAESIAPASPNGSGTGATALFSAGASAAAPARADLLSTEEKSLPPAERLARSKEYFDQGESFMESDMLKEAREEFQKAFALDADCKVCLIRLSKVEGEIKKTLEKYKNDALRSQAAMEYDKARRFWEMVLELESDPEGQRIARQGIADAREKLQKRSYR